MTIEELNEFMTALRAAPEEIQLEVLRILREDVLDPQPEEQEEKENA